MSNGFARSESRLVTAAGRSVPLDAVEVEANLDGLCARVRVTQRYTNREPNPIEAVYVFPLDEGAAVCGFEAVIDGRRVVGEVQEREAAFEQYDDAMERGDGAYLLDEERADVFTASVGNLPPGAAVSLTITYVTELDIRGGAVSFVVPATVAPRYAPASDHVTVGRSDADALNPPRALEVPYGLELTVRAGMPAAITRVESPSHPIRVSVDGHTAVVGLSQRSVPLDRDFVLEVAVEGLDQPCAWSERDATGAETIAVAFQPSFPAMPAASEIVFLIDRSGSMDGTSIEEVRRAMQLCLRSLIPGCCFNIVGFGSTFAPLFAGSRPYDDASLEAASAHVGALLADMNGTEILPALRHVLEQPALAGLRRQVVVLTDGEVTNTDAVLALAAEHADRTRIYTFGIGRGASRHLVRGLARVGGGAAEFVHPGERIEPKVVRQFGRLLAPALTDVRVEWDGEVVQSPARVPAVFEGDRCLVYGFVKGARPAGVRLSATSATGPVRFEVPLTSIRAASGTTVGTLAARTRIRELEESGQFTTARASKQARTSTRVTDEIVRLSRQYGLISRETSFVAIERRETPVTGEIKLRRVPVALTSEWGGIARRPVAVAMMAAPPAPTPGAVGMADMGTAVPRMASGSRRVLERRPTLFSRWHAPGKAQPAAGGLPTVPSSAALRQDVERLQELAALQHADGSWTLDTSFARAIGRDFLALEQALAAASGAGEEAARAWATSLALVWLGREAAALEDEWRALAAKARRWLDQVSARPTAGGTWLDVAEALFDSAAV